MEAGIKRRRETMAHQQIISRERIAVGHLMSAIDWLLSDRRCDETGIAEPSDAALDLLQSKIDEIETGARARIPFDVEWEFYEGQNPDFSGYTVAHYFTGRPDLGWCLYSRGHGGTWNQRTLELYAPQPGLVPQFIDGKWYWIDPAPPPAAKEIVEFSDESDPEANGRRPQIGERRYTMIFPLADGRVLHLHMGVFGAANLRKVIMDEYMDDIFEIQGPSSEI
jgi:hypothetical protein